MTPLAYYLNLCEQRLLVHDEQQVAVLQQLQTFYVALCEEHKKRNTLTQIFRQPKAVVGFYLWGGVGIGKTMMMDCFYHALPFQQKLRLHFHQFMQYVHEQLKHYQGNKNPLEKVAAELAKKTMVLCFDEILVNDIADAMILARLLTALSSHGISLLVTSNLKPDDLYKHGLQRISFLPAITLIKKITTVIHLGISIDYRLAHLHAAGMYFVPNDDIARVNMEKSFDILSQNQLVEEGQIELYDRHIDIIKKSKEVIWFDFTKLCTPPRSQHDYLALVKQYRTILISNIPRMLMISKNQITLFIRMIDIFYDARIRLICSAEVNIEQLYPEGEMLFEFKRTQSRLHEMFSEKYLLIK